jgi:hypothetical protein
MKVFVITLALAGLASTATLDAQILGSRPVPSTNGSVNADGSWRTVGSDANGNTIYERRIQDRNGNIVVQRARRDGRGNMSIFSSTVVGNNTGTGTTVDGSWRVVGRDGNGNAVYERRTQDRNGNIVVQRAVRDSRGNMSIISTNTIANGNNRNSNNCAYTQSTNTVGDIIFGRNNGDVNCDDNGSRVDGGWYQVGRGRDNNSIYERRVRDANGNLVIQRARRNSNGTFTIISTRSANDNDKQWRKAQKEREKELKKSERDDRGDDHGRGKGEHDRNDDDKRGHHDRD